jgi:dTDP-4-dehydrorhamnose reductase
MRVAVTGANGRLGRALISALGDAPFTGPRGPVAWTRDDFDLDTPSSVAAPLERDRPEVIVHAAAWTDVDGCARDPELAMRRNGEAVGALAEAAAAAGIDLLVVSTNEVFDGKRDHDRGYRAGDPASPANAYGRSKLAGEEAGAAAYRGSGSSYGVVRTSWLYGPPGNDFPAKILAAADRATAAGEPLRVVGDEFASPTSAHDLAEGIVELLAEGAIDGIHHLVATGVASRADWAREVFRRTGLQMVIEEVPSSTWERASTPPAWGVLEATPMPSGEPMRPWQQGLADYLPMLIRQRAAVVR